MNKGNNVDFENCTKYWICNNNYVHNDVKLRDHCHITGKYRCSAIVMLIIISVLN